MMELLQQYITSPYLQALVVFITVLVVMRSGLHLLQVLLQKFVKRTLTKVDDILMKRMFHPLTFLATFLSMLPAVAITPLEEAMRTIIDNFLYSALVFTAGYIVYATLDVVLEEGIKKFARKSRTKVDDSLLNLFHNVLKIAFWTITLLYVLSIWGVEIAPLLATLGVAGLAVALALQPTLANIFSGASVILDKSIGKNDWIKLDDGTVGEVTKIGLRSTRIRTFDNEMIIIPNSKLADSRLQNIALPEPLSRVVIPFGVAYGSDVEKVKKTVMKEIRKVGHVVKEPAPFVKFLEMGDSALLFKAYFYVESYENRFDALDEANTKVYNALRKAKIEIPFPQMDVHIKK